VECDSDSSDESISTSASESTSESESASASEDEAPSPTAGSGSEALNPLAAAAAAARDANAANLLCAVAPGLPRLQPLVLGVSGGARAGRGSAAVLVRRDGLAPSHLAAKRWAFDDKSQLVPYAPPDAPPSKTALRAQPPSNPGSFPGSSLPGSPGSPPEGPVGVGAEVVLSGRTPNAVKRGPPDAQQWRRDQEGFLATKAAPQLVLGLRGVVAAGGGAPGSALALVPRNDPRAVRWQWISPTGGLRGFNMG
jgi:hypothetical protein